MITTIDSYKSISSFIVKPLYATGMRHVFCIYKNIIGNIFIYIFSLIELYTTQMMFTRDKIMSIILLITVLLISLLLASYTEGLENMMMSSPSIERKEKPEQEDFKLFS
jgi:magnesium-transporting ATPase (P-type)